mmetsp:Transcript_2494/g.5726  ORF Transcript_2494/g.5726 Transcript_2494/m.5726 type:complete len:118 (-) Transcript_2494:212-565(-)
MLLQGLHDLIEIRVIFYKDHYASKRTQQVLNLVDIKIHNDVWHSFVPQHQISFLKSPQNYKPHKTARFSPCLTISSGCPKTGYPEVGRGPKVSPSSSNPLVYCCFPGLELIAFPQNR